MQRVLVTDNLSTAGVDILRNTEGIEVVVENDFKSLSLEEKRAGLAEFDGVIIRSGMKMTPELLEGLERLSVIVRAGVGVDNINLDAATNAGIVVMNTPAGNTTSTAEHTVAMMMALCRNIGPAAQSMKEGRWDRKKFTGSELSGKTLAIVGLGRIGLNVARIAQGLEMKVVGYDPFFPLDRGRDFGITVSRDLDEVVSQADLLTVHTPMTDETRGIINLERMNKMPKGARIVNCARGGIVNEADLLEALNSGQIAGAALDVYTQEPPVDRGLAEHPNVLATPHLGASTDEAQEGVALEAAEIICEYLLHREIRHSVNTAPISGTEMEDMHRYIDLAYRLGLLMFQLAGSKGIKSATINYRGDIAEKKTRILTSSFASGLLERSLDGNINLINAVARAAEKGIPLTESSSAEQGDFSGMIHVVVNTDAGEFQAAGTVFGRGYLRLIRLDQFHLDAFLDGHLLIYRHIDRPGQIGRIGQILGKHKVNIADMSLGRLQSKSGGDSIAVLHLDEAPSQEALDEIANHEDVTAAQVVSLPCASQGLPWMTTTD